MPIALYPYPCLRGLSWEEKTLKLIAWARANQKAWEEIAKQAKQAKQIEKEILAELKAGE